MSGPPLYFLPLAPTSVLHSGKKNHILLNKLDILYFEKCKILKEFSASVVLRTAEVGEYVLHIIFVKVPFGLGFFFNGCAL